MMPVKNIKSIKAWSIGVFLLSILIAACMPMPVGAAGTEFVTNGSTSIGTFPSSLPNNSFRIDTTTTNAASVTAISANFVGSSSATLSPTTGWTQIQNSSVDDSSLLVNFGFTVSFNNTNYTGVYVGSNTYLTFGSGSSNYSGLSASNPAIPGVHMCAADNSYQKVFYKLDNASTMRVRYEGNNATSGTVGSPTIVYEAVFYSGQKYFDVYMGSNSRCGGDTTAPTISNVNSSAANGTYKAGAVIPITITFSEAVTSTGNVTVTLETGVVDRTCTFTVANSSSGSCNYTVQAGDTSADLTVASISGTIKDAANNTLTNFVPVTNLAANKALIIDTTSPTVSNVTSTLANGSYKSGQVVPVQVVFTENVTVTGTPQLLLLTGTPVTTAINYTSGSGTNTLIFNYTVASGNASADLDYASTGALSLNGGTITDTVGNAATLTLVTPGAVGSLAANKALVIDNTVPTVVLSSTASSLTNVSPIPVTVTFSESVSNFIVGDISVTNGTAGSFAGSGASYTFSVTPSGQGGVTINIPASSGQDAAGNLTAVSNTLSFTYDSVVPTVTITTVIASPTLTTPIPFTATFTEPVTGFTVSDIDVTNATVGNLSGSGTTYTFDVSPIGHPTLNVDVTVFIAASRAQDAAGNGNSGSNSATPYAIRFDNHSPTVSLVTAAPDPTTTSPISVTATFSEAVTGFAAGDVSATNGSVGNFSGSGTTYTFDVTPTGQGVVTVSVPASVSEDAAHNLNLPSNLLSRSFDSAPPDVALTTGSATPTNVTSFSVTATFSEAVTGFAAGDVSATNGSVGNFSGSGTTYTFDVTPTGQGVVTVSVPASMSQDAAGNDNTVSNILSITYDTVGPVLAEVTPVPSTTTNTTPSYTFSSTEPGVITYSGDCSANTSAVSGDNSKTFATVALGFHNNCAIVVTDSAGNVSSPLVVSAFTVVTPDEPTLVAAVFTDSTLTIGETSLVTFTFSKAVTGFTNADLVIPNGTLTTVSSGDGGTVWTATFTPSINTESQVNVLTVNLAGLTDLASVAGIGTASSANFIVDTLAPSVVITDNKSGIVLVGEVIVYTFTFSESVSGFTVGGINVSNGTRAADFATNTGTVYTLVVTPDTNSTSSVTVDVPAGIATDAYGNFNTSAIQSVQTVDTVAPESVVAAPAPGSYTTPQSITLTSTGADIIRYGASPTCTSGTVYTGAIEVQTTQTIEAVGCDANGNSTSVGSFTYTISKGGVALPAFAFMPPTAPSGGYGVSMQGGVKSTGKPDVLLEFSAGQDIVRMALSNTPNFEGAVQEPFTATRQWNICGKGAPCAKGTHTVYVKFYNIWGQSSPIVSYTVLYDQGISTPTLGVGVSSAPSQRLLLSKGTIYLILNGKKYGFASSQAFLGLGYAYKNVVKGDVATYPDGATVLSRPIMAHLPGSWVLHTKTKTVYYVTTEGIAPVPTWELFLANGGKPSYIVPANGADLQAPVLTPVSVADERIQYNGGL